MSNYFDHLLSLSLVDRIARTTYVDEAYCYRVAWYAGLSVCRSVCRSVTLVSPAKTAEAIEMPLGLWARTGPRTHVLDGGNVKGGKERGDLL